MIDSFNLCQKEPTSAFSSSKISSFSSTVGFSGSFVSVFFEIIFNTKTAKEKHPEALFVAIIPGLFERNGRGLPYILDRYNRANLAISLGADIAIEGPPMGVMGSGQYSLCLSLLFKTLNADYIPRGYISQDAKFKNILNYINNGKPVAPRPYKIISMDDKKVLLDGKLSNDDYVIVSLAKSLTKLDFDYKGKFIFIPRLENVSGSLIREKISHKDFDNLDDMLPQNTIDTLKKAISESKAPLHEYRAERILLDNVNTFDEEKLSSLTLMDDRTVENIINNRPFEDVSSILETGILKDEIHKYINNYPQKIRVLGYKNEETLSKFKNNLNNNSIGDNKIICQ